MYENKVGYDFYLSSRTQELLEEGCLTKIFELVDKDLRGAWATTLPQDTQARESLYHQIHALSLLRINIETLVNNLKFPRGDR